MKRTALLLVILFFLFPLYGDSFYETRTDHYQIKSTLSSEVSAQTGYILEQLYALFTELTGIPKSPLLPLRVLEFEDKESFDSYLSSSWDMESQAYLLLRFGKSGDSELVIYRNNGDLNLKELTHLATFQYLEACNSETPYWLKQGLARYFEIIELNENDLPIISFNWGAYEEFSNIKTKMPLERLIYPHDDTLGFASDEFNTQCWAFTHFLMNAKGNGARLLWDFLYQVRTGQSGEWPQIDSQLWESQYLAFMNEIKPATSLAIELQSLFEKDYYTKALNLIQESEEEDSWLGLYYIGLIHYERGLYEDSLKEFTLALNRGGAEDVMKYAMGLSQLELGERREGIRLLKEAREINESIIPDSLSPLLE